MTPERLAEIQADDARYIGQMAPITAEGQRRELLAEVQRLTDDRDSALSTMGRYGDALGKITAFKLTEHPNDQGWLIVADDARQLRAIAGRSKPTAEESAS